MARKPTRAVLAKAVRTWLNPVRYGLERWSYTLQRVSGVIVAFYFIAHIIETGYVVGGPSVWAVRPDAYEYAKSVWTQTVDYLSNPLFDAGLTVIGIMVAFHAVNGVRLFLAHFGWGLGRPSRPEPLTRPKAFSGLERALFWVAVLLSAFAMIYALHAFFGVL
jgi:succinate dehydrogenase / fumarate reductase cytochrome b subunit